MCEIIFVATWITERMVLRACWIWGLWVCTTPNMTLNLTCSLKLTWNPLFSRRLSQVSCHLIHSQTPFLIIFVSFLIATLAHKLPEDKDILFFLILLAIPSLGLYTQTHLQGRNLPSQWSSISSLPYLYNYGRHASTIITFCQWRSWVPERLRKLPTVT